MTECASHAKTNMRPECPVTGGAFARHPIAAASAPNPRSICPQEQDQAADVN
jgi:hypothetical protein